MCVCICVRSGELGYRTLERVGGILVFERECSTCFLFLFCGFFLLHSLFPFLHFFIVLQVQLSPFSCHHFPPPPTPTPHNQSCPSLTLSMVTLYMFFDNLSLSYPHYSPPPPLWLLSVYSLFQCLWLYFACFFILLSRFHL